MNELISRKLSGVNLLLNPSLRGKIPSRDDALMNGFLFGHVPATQMGIRGDWRGLGENLALSIL
ncbi:MAG: hypothetical protein ACFFD9_02390 [Candidatus Thorarchaeota archaeon]